MKAEQLLDLLGEVKDEHVLDADKPPKKNRHFLKWAALAACFVATVSIGAGILRMLPIGGASAGGAGHEEGSVFMSYAGPVFPLTLTEENAAISATRDVTLDFSPWEPVWVSNEEEAASHTDLTEEERQQVLDDLNEWYPEGGYYTYSDDILVTDSYTLTNSSDEAQSVCVLYPFASSLGSLASLRPTLTLDGAELEAKLHAGSYAGGFEGAWGSKNEAEGSVNLRQLRSWEGYAALLEDGSYLDRAMGDFPDFSSVPVTVYTLSDPWGPEEDNKAGIPNPSIRVMFSLNYSKTQVLSYGFNGGLWDEENGIMGKSFSIPQKTESRYGESYYLLVIGDDIHDLTTQGYVTGGWDTKNTIDAGVTVTRSESDLESSLRMLAKLDERDWAVSEPESEEDFELYFGLLKEQLLAYGVLSSDPVERYENGDFEGMHDVSGVARVFWLEAEITIPANGSVTLEANARKESSYDFACTGTENKGVKGFDLVTKLASNLTFTGQSAHLEDRGLIDIVRQNFGFDPENGVLDVPLDLDTPHYYLEVRRKDEK